MTERQNQACGGAGIARIGRAWKLPQFRGRVSNLESLLASLQRYDQAAKVVVFLDASYLARLEQVGSRYAVHTALTYPIQEADLEKAL